MTVKQRRRHEASVELTPLIDVVFLLLIFFMVSTEFVRETQLKIDLPEASGEATAEQDDIIEVTVDRAGDYAVNGELLLNQELSTLVQALQSAKSRYGADATLIITADASAEHQAFVRAMDAAGKVGLVRIRVTTKHPDGPAE